MLGKKTEYFVLVLFFQINYVFVCILESNKAIEVEAHVRQRFSLALCVWSDLGARGGGVQMSVGGSPNGDAS